MSFRVMAALLVMLFGSAAAAQSVDDETLFQARCDGLCHQRPEPSMLKAAQWLKVLNVMQKRMTQHGVEPLTEAEFDQLLNYLQANSRDR